MFFTFFGFFYENNQEHNLLLDCAFELFTYTIYMAWKFMSGFSAFVLNLLSRPAMFYLDQWQCKSKMHCSAQYHHIVIGRADILILLHGTVRDGSWWATCKYNNYAWCRTSGVKSVYGKSQSIKGMSSYFPPVRQCLNEHTGVFKIPQ